MVTALVGAFLVPAPAARAGSDGFVTLDFTGESPARLGYISFGHRTILTQVGQAVFRVHDELGSYGGTGGDDIVTYAEDHKTTGYCIDVYQAITAGRKYKFDVVDLADAPTLRGNADRALDLENLFAKYQDQVTSPDTAAAFAAAVWEIVNETKTNLQGDPVYNVRGGAFQVTPASGGRWDRLANQWLCDLDTNVPDDDQLAYALVSAKVQDFAWVMSVPHSGGNPPVPEPLTLVSGFLAVSGLGLYMRKRVKVVAAA
jgi:hypothetical protein